MFIIKWVLKNIYRNKKRTFTQFSFITAAAFILVFMASFEKGAAIQVEELFRKTTGDIMLWAKSDNHSTDNALAGIKKNYSSEIAGIYNFKYLRNSRIINENMVEMCLVIGAGSSYFELLKENIYWADGNIYGNNDNAAVMEYNFAKSHNLNKGDLFTIQITTESGAINTSKVKVAGIFIADKYGYQNEIFVPERIINELSFDEKKIDKTLIFLKTPNKGKIYDIVNFAEKRFENEIGVSVSSWGGIRTSSIYVFKSVWMVMRVVLSIIGIVSLFVMFTALFNSFFIAFHSRTQEISTLMTYGMKNIVFYLIAVLEAVIIIIPGFAVGVIFNIASGAIVGKMIFSDKLSELTTVLGGPYMRFSILPGDILFIFVFMFLTGIWAALRSTRYFLKKEIREVVSMNR